MAFATHPDTSGHNDANERFNFVFSHKSDPSALLKKAAEWGLSIDIPAEFQDEFDRYKARQAEAKTEPRNEHFERKVYDAVYGAVVKWYYTYQFKTRLGYGIISRVRTIKRGKFAGRKEFTVMDLPTGTEKKLKSDAWGNHPFYTVERMADENAMRKAEEIIQISKARKKVEKDNKIERYRMIFEEKGLRQNHTYGKIYRDEVLIEFTRIGAKWCPVQKTTNFMVFYTSPSGHNRRCDVRAIQAFRSIPRPF